MAGSTQSGGRPPLARGAGAAPDVVASRRGPIVLLAVAGLAALAMLVGVLPGVRPHPGVVPLLDDVIQCVGYVAAAAAAVWIALVARTERLLWWLVAGSLVLRAYGFVHTIYVLDRAPVYPSTADAAWITSSVLLVGALIAIGRRATGGHALGVLGLDAMLAGLTATALTTTLLDNTIDALVEGGLPFDVVLTNMTYPLLDVALLAVLAGLLVVSGWRLSPDTVVLAVGVLVFASVDAWFLYLVTSGGLQPGNVLAPLSLAGTALVAGAGVVRTSPARRVAHETSLVPPVVLAVTCVMVLAYDSIGAVSQLGNIAAASGVVVAIARAFVTLTGDRRASEETIAEKNEELLRFRALVEASADYIGIGTLQGEILFLNPSARRMSGMAPDEPLESFTISRALTDEAAVHAREVERPQIMETGSWQGESALRNQSGTGPPVPVYKNTFVIRDEAGDPWLLGTIQRDITELKEAESYIERFRSLVEASSDFIALAELDGTVIYLNPAGRQLVGLGEDVDVATTTISDYLTEEGLRASSEVEQPAVVATGRWHGESTLRDLHGGPPIPVTINSFLVRKPDTGEPWLLATVQRDITDLHAARGALQRLADQRQELLRHLVDAQEAERSRIAADVHDDPVQVMAAVDLQLGLVQRHLEASQDPQATLTLLDQMRRTVSEANDRLRYLLFDLDSPAQREDVETALGEAAAYVLKDAVRWDVRCEAGLELDETTRVLVYRIAKEAMVNVRKHAAATRVHIDVRRLEDGVEVTVADDGVGLPPEPFAPRPGHRGVSDMRDRAAIAGGSVTLGEGPDGGTVMRLWIPLSADAD